MGLEVSPGSGDVYIADMMNDNVSIFTGNGSLIGTFSCPAAADVAIAPDNTYLYVTSGSYGNNCVYMCDIYGNVLGSWGHEGSGPGEFNDPCGVAVAPNGDVYVSDTNNDRIQYFTYDGSFLGMWGSFGTGEGQFARPWGLSVDCYSRVFVADHKNSRVQYFTSNGNFLGIWGSYGSGNGEFIGTDDVVLTPDAFVAYVSDYGNHRIQYFYENAGGDGGANPGTLVSISPTSLGKIKALYK
jgi:tripartite motif-containing protein 71